MPKPKLDKSKYSKAGKEQHPVKVVSTKRPVTKPPAKDKAVLSSLRCAPRELGKRVAKRLGHPSGSQTCQLSSALLLSRSIPFSS